MVGFYLGLVFWGDNYWGVFDAAAVVLFWSGIIVITLMMMVGILVIGIDFLGFGVGIKKHGLCWPCFFFRDF